MRKLVLVTALLLVSAAAQAGGSRSLTLASSDAAPAAAAQQPNAAEAPRFAGRPSLRQRHGSLRMQRGNPAAAQRAQAMRAAQMRHRRPHLLARVVYALHRHGIYW